MCDEGQQRADSTSSWADAREGLGMFSWRQRYLNWLLKDGLGFNYKKLEKGLGASRFKDLCVSRCDMSILESISRDMPLLMNCRKGFLSPSLPFFYFKFLHFGFILILGIMMRSLKWEYWRLELGRGFTLPSPAMDFFLLFNFEHLSAKVEEKKLSATFPCCRLALMLMTGFTLLEYNFWNRVCEDISF